MTPEQQYQAFLADLAAEQQAYPRYPDLNWYAHTGDTAKYEEIMKYGRTVPDFETFKEILKSQQFAIAKI